MIAFLADAAIVDPYFCLAPVQYYEKLCLRCAAQASEAYDSKLANPFTKFFCKEAFDILEDGIINDKHHLLPYGAMLSGIDLATHRRHWDMRFHTCQMKAYPTAMPYHPTTVAHKFNKSIYYERFKRICQKLKFEPIS